MKLMPPLRKSRPVIVVQASHPYPIILTIAVFFSLLFHAPAVVAQSDVDIVASARNSYVFRVLLAGDAVTPHARNGAVTLTGNVTEGSHKMLAQDTASALPGVRSVDNQIEVKGGPAENSDAWLHLRVKATLSIHQSVSTAKTVVEVKSGVVTLKGEAATEAQKEQVADYVFAVNGVRSVTNEMTVFTEPKPRLRKAGEQTAKITAEVMDDASITAQAKMALVSHRTVGPLPISVTTQGGVLTLGGAASNAVQRDLVTRLVTDINGVKSVVNNMSTGTAAAKN
jgi:hyperosmotically inducible protein